MAKSKKEIPDEICDDFLEAGINYKNHMAEVAPLNADWCYCMPDDKQQIVVYASGAFAQKLKDMLFKSNWDE